jgi:ribose 5-phosphate isomerase B
LNIAIGCDEAGFQLKHITMTLLRTLGHTVKDYGCYNENPVLYPEVGHAVAAAVAAGEHERGILICGTGIGMCITANKVPGIRAAVCHDSFSTVRSRCSNDAQVMCMGARVIGSELAKQLVGLWLENDFSGGGSTAKVEKITRIEEIYSTSSPKRNA